MLHCEREVRLQVIELGAAVVAHALELIGEDVLVLEQRCDGVGELYLPARARGLMLQVVEDARNEDVAPDYTELTTRPDLGSGFLRRVESSGVPALRAAIAELAQQALR